MYFKDTIAKPWLWSKNNKHILIVNIILDDVEVKYQKLTTNLDIQYGFPLQNVFNGDTDTKTFI